ncbi:hypothetical protein [Methylobacterium persicinum]|uniref:Uncharacterized protein n=1 Tax=Methylobacterium persicinum TaxID=374426 RepID=A0ABU0HJJ6_9HYPH|nr:hypothetical protein [Methylobacterium persicinum]MDQ0442486.1 hypothetical protein [Methylobacterium persicinum]GJE40524.1 hypothetical protein KHHGKMAE_4619 [Methylobacterium persicinum]
MTATTDLIGLTLAFYGAMPPPRPPRPERDGPTWAAALLIGGVCLATVGPMITIWGFHRPEAAAKTRCLRAGGRIVYGALDGSDFHCDSPGPARSG